MTQKHIIKKLILDLTLDSQVGSFTFQSKVGTLLNKEIVPLIDQYCSAVDTGNRVIRIDKLEMDLGRINKQGFDREFKPKVAQLLPQKLSDVLKMSLSHDLSKGKICPDHFREQADRDFAVLEFFINEGCLPWWVNHDESYEMSVLLEQSIVTQPAKMKDLIIKIVDNTVSVKRLLYHTDDEVLAQIIALFQPEYVQTIYRLALTLSTGLANCPLLKSFGLIKIRPEVWVELLLQTVASEGQGFNRRQVVDTTVKQLAPIFNVGEYELYNQLVLSTPELFSRSIFSKDLPFQTKEYQQQQEKLTQLLKEFQLTLVVEILQPQLAEFERRLAELQFAPDAAVKKVKAAQKTIKAIGKALVAITKLYKLLTNQPMSEDPERLARYTGQLETIEKLLIKLSAGTEFEAVAGKLAQVLQTMQNTGQLLISLLNESRKGGSSSTNVDDRTIEQIGAKLGRSLDRLRHDLAAITGQSNGAALQELTQKISHSINSVEKMISTTSVPRDISGYCDPFSASEEIYVSNAGSVLLWPYLPQFFGALGLVSANRFIDDATAERAVFLLHYLVSGTEKVQEYELMLNKIICGMDKSVPVKPCLKITKVEKAECESLLQAVILNWPAIKNVSIQGLRSMFLKREGLIHNRDGQMVLRIAGAPYDILVNRVPWGIRTVKLPWMEQLLLVEWGEVND